MSEVKSELALLGGSKGLKVDSGDIFRWPIVTKEHEEAVLEVLRAGNMSGLDVTRKFERAYADTLDLKYGLCTSTGTGALQCAFWGLEIGVGDEVIGPSTTYWASLLPLYSLGATPVFAEIDPDTLCIDPNDIEHRITPRTKGIVVVHYGAHPADMDPIMAIAEKHNIPVIEDVSHAQGGLYKGKKLGTFGIVSAASLMSGKSFAIGEAGIMTTNDQRIYERAILFGQYARHSDIELEDLKKYKGIPCGGYKYRTHQLSSAFGMVTLKLYDDQIAEIDKAMNYFYDMIDEIDGIEGIRPAKDSGSTMAGWYAAFIKYDPAAFGGLSVKRFVDALVAEGTEGRAGVTEPLHLHPVFMDMDIYGHGKPTRVANLPEGATIDQPEGSLPISEGINDRAFLAPWFKHNRPEIIKAHAEVFKKVAANYKDLLADDEGGKAGGYSTSFKR